MRTKVATTDYTTERTVRTVTNTIYRLVNVPPWVKRARFDHRVEHEVKLELERQFGVETVNYTYGTSGVRKRNPRRTIEVDQGARVYVIIPAGAVVQYLQDSETICFIADVRLDDGRVVQVAFDQFGKTTTVRLTAYAHMAL